MMISAYSFGKICVNGTWYTSDLQINDTLVIPGWWRRSGHVCELDDVRDILANRPEVLILGQGQPGMMHSAPGLKKFLAGHRIELIEQPTAQAVLTFNGLHESRKVAAGFHLTC